MPPPEGPDDPPGVTVDPVTLRPGENGTATVTARNVGEVHVRRPGDGVVEVRISSVELTPSPDQVYPTPNPYWEWDPVRPEVTVEVPVEVPPDADPGTYCGSAVRVWNDTDHDHEGGATGRIVVRVPNASDGG
ncbi:hypothetical protein BRD00_02240 [Halobacteriales archaeon QS_8_69_26]|nr:MAG: hypothetical protein BRD00_02240 [Halobacteriales archaeon QS_8_69_26]